MNVAAIMPCRGRAAQTLANVRRLLATAGMAHGVDWTLYLVGGQDEHALITEIAGTIVQHDRHSIVIATSTALRLPYWEALAHVTQATTAPLICNLANDLLPGQHWLQRGLEAYQAVFGPNDGLLGFNDGHHRVDHACHFLISRALLDSFGGWPVWYDHNYGDTELCARAQAQGRYAKAPWAVLYHDHPYFGGADDATYAEGRTHLDRDGRLFNERRRAGWPAIV